jgi:hypothetical protein
MLENIKNCSADNNLQDFLDTQGQSSADPGP